MEPLFLVDGSGYIYRAFYAIQPLSNSKGLPTNALLGFTRMLAKLIRDKNAKYITIAFDTAEPTFRHVKYSEYKANRKEVPAELVPQFEYFQPIAEALGIKVLVKPGFEADDIIGTICKRFRSPEQKITIVSGDKDLAQLVDDSVVVWDGMRDIRYDRDGVKSKFGVFPEQIVDFLALTGDTSDNVPGIRGIGPKTAEALLSRFGTIDQMLANIPEIEQIEGLRGAKGVRAKIESSVEALRLSRELVRLECDVEPFNGLDGINIFEWNGVDHGRAAPLFAELEFEQVINGLRVSDQTSAAAVDGSQPGSAGIDSGRVEDEFVTITAGSLHNFAADLKRQPIFAFDTETSSLAVHSCRLVGISISWQDGKGYYLPIDCDNEKERCLDSAQVRDLLGPIFSDPAVKKIGANLKFDIGVLEEHGYRIEGAAFDVMLASYVLTPDRRQHGLKDLAANHLNVQMKTYEQTVGDCDSIAAVPIDEVTRYAGHDAEATWRLKAVLEKQLGERGSKPSLRSVFEDIEMPLVPVLSKIERTGIKVDLELLERLDTSYTAELAELEQEIQHHAGSTFNINSPKQLSEILFDRLGISTKGVRKTQGGYSTDAEVLSKLAPEHPIAAKLLEYRELFKLKTTYVESLRRLARPDTARVHTSFNQAVAATGRLSSTDPNLQNIPIRNIRGRELRKVFIAEKGCKLISADYSQIELRLLAHLSGDSSLQQAFVRGEDIHLATAKELFGGALIGESEMKDLRRVAKTINFGIVYGMGAFRLAGELGISRAQAQQYIDNYFGRYPRVRKYFDELTEQSERLGYVESLFGRRRYSKDIDTSGRDSGYANRSLLNAPLQGSAAEIIKLAMINLYRVFKDRDSEVRMVLQVHDELVFEVSDDSVDSAANIIRSEMENAVQLLVPLKVDLSISTDWGKE